MISPQAIVGTGLAPALSLPASADFTGKVAAVADGDTVKVLRGREQVKVRLFDIDAPESRQAYESRAKQSLSDLCFNKTAKVDDSGKDRYARTLARLYCETVLMRTLSRFGVAWLGYMNATRRKTRPIHEAGRSESSKARIVGG